MNNEQMGQLIVQQRKQRGLTQKDLAEQLHVTDKAVSKWERGLSYPDIALLVPLAEALCIEVSALLQGADEVPSAEDSQAAVGAALQYADKRLRHNRTFLGRVCRIIMHCAVLIAAVVCFICDFALTQTFSWSLLVLACLVYGWAVLTPLFYFNLRGIKLSLLAASVGCIPFLYALALLLPLATLLLPIGVPICVFSILYVWCVYGLIAHKRSDPWLVAAVIALLSLPLVLGINFVETLYTGSPFWDVSNILSSATLLLLAGVCFIFARKAHKQRAR